jgi:RNA polymerase sigma factor (sigma-70 family)
MTAARALQIDDWVVHRPNVVRSVAARVPGIDAEEAASRALEKMVRIVSTGGTIDDPAPYWRRAAVNEAISMTREAGRAHPVEDDTLDGLTPPVAGAELDAERHADVTMLRTALSDLADDDRQILLERHVHDRAVADIATNLGVRPHAVTMRLRRAEERLAGAFAAAHAQGVNEPECRTTRAAMHDYLKDRLLPRRRNRFEAHMDGCAECTRAFVDVREVSWMLRDLGQHVIAGAIATGALGAAVGGAAAGAAGGAAGAGGAGAAGAGAPRPFGKKEAAIAAGVLAALALGGGAAALVANQAADPPAAESAPVPGGGAGVGAGEGAGAGEGGGAAGEGAGGEGAGAGSGDAGDDAGSDGSDEGDGSSEGGTDDRAADDGAGAGDGGASGSDGAGGSGDTGSGSSDSANGANSPSEGGAGSDPGPGTNSFEGGGVEGGGAEGSGTADDPLPDIGAAVTDWIAWFGIGGEPSDGQNGGSDNPGTGSANGGDTGWSDADGSDADGNNTGGSDTGGSDTGGRPAAGGDPNTGGRDGTGDGSRDGSRDGDSTGTDGGTGDGTTTADGGEIGIGAEVTSWLAKLGVIGIPGFLLIVLILWLWERWTRAEEG